MLTHLSPIALARVRTLAAERAQSRVRGIADLQPLTDRIEHAIEALPPAAQAELMALAWIAQIEPVPAWRVLLEHAVAATDASTPWTLASNPSLGGLIERGLRVLAGDG